MTSTWRTQPHGWCAMPEISYEQAASALAARTDLPPFAAAATRLLLWHETWLRRADFRRACLTTRPLGVNWDAVHEFRDSNPPRASTSQMIMLDVVLVLVEDSLNFRHLGHAHKRAVAEAYATALGQALAEAEPVHNHPEFIPCEPSSCPAHATEGIAQ
jgi:hypothetical protein